ncbi:hypothetical protein HZS_7863 [Henneguya salminicola]|nr:hypothetical protein HZS_7863 [Henneguya salminicola]
MNYYKDTSSEYIIVQVALSHYFPLDYGIKPKKQKMESVGLIIKSEVGIMHSRLMTCRDTIHIMKL